MADIIRGQKRKNSLVRPNGAAPVENDPTPQLGEREYLLPAEAAEIVHTPVAAEKRPMAPLAILPARDFLVSVGNQLLQFRGGLRVTVEPHVLQVLDDAGAPYTKA